MPTLSVFVISHKEVIEESKEALRPVARVPTFTDDDLEAGLALLWGTTWHMQVRSWRN